jgi:hypothetical protein
VKGTDRGLILRYYPTTFWKVLRKTTDISVKIVGGPAEILTEDLPSKRKFTAWANLLGFV